MLEALHRHAQGTFDDMEGQDIAATGKLEEGAQSSESQVATAYRVMALLLKMVEEGKEQIRLDVGKAHGSWWLAEVSPGEAEEEHQPIAVAGYRARTDGTLGHEVLGEEQLYQHRERGGLGCTRFTHGALPTVPSWTRTSSPRVPSVPVWR